MSERDIISKTAIYMYIIIMKKSSLLTVNKLIFCLELESSGSNQAS